MISFKRKDNHMRRIIQLSILATILFSTFLDKGLAKGKTRGINSIFYTITSQLLKIFNLINQAKKH